MRPGKMEEDFATILEKVKAESKTKNESFSKLASDMGVDIKDVSRLDHGFISIADRDSDEIKLLRKNAPPAYVDPAFSEIINEAHPDTIVVCDAPGNGGVIENNNEQHAAIMEKITRTPTGFSYNGLHGLLAEFDRTANALEARGMIKEAEELTQIAEEVLVSIVDLKKKVNKRAAPTPSQGTPHNLPEVHPLDAEFSETNSNEAASGGEHSMTDATVEMAVGGAASMVIFEGAKKAITKIWSAVRPNPAMAVKDEASAVATMTKTLPASKIMGLAAKAKNPWVIGALVAATLTAATYKAFTGSKMENLEVDLDDLLKEMNSLAANDYGTASNHAIQNMVMEAQQMKVIYVSMVSADMPADQLVTNIKTLQTQYNKLYANFNTFRGQASGVIRNIVGFPNLENLMEDIGSSFQAFNKNYMTQLAATDSEVYNHVVESVAAADSNEPDLSGIGRRSKTTTEHKSNGPSNDDGRIKEVQTFLKGFYPNIRISGEIDSETSRAAEDFADKISRALDITNITANKILNEGTRSKLQALYDSYRNRDAIIAEKMGL